MKILLDIDDSKAGFIMELLRNFKFVKAKPLTPHNAEVLENLKDAVSEVTLIKQGKIKGTSAKDLLHEL